MRHFSGRIARYVRGLVGLRSSDTLLTSFPRSGSTWIRFFLCNLVSLREMDGRTVGFPLLDATMVELGVDDLRRPWPHTTIPRVVKTHRPRSVLFSRAGAAILVSRDPRDAVVSLYWYERGKTRPRFQGDLGEFLRHPRLGLPAWFRHYRSWAPHADLTLTYEELVADPSAQFARLLSFLGVGEEEAVVAEALERSHFRNVRAVERSEGHTREDKFGPEFRFARRGGSGSWQEHFSEKDERYYTDLHRHYGIGIYPP